jgi:polysaccharide deacetylase family protein (PEP-CTERM system associated)
MIRHHFTVDVEEYFQVSAFEKVVTRADWDGLQSRVQKSVSILLAMLARAGSKGTFFVLGWIAERHPGLVVAIARAGHEVASHGWDHRRITAQRPDEFRESVRRSKKLLEDITGTPVIGFRAPSFSIVPGYEWAFDILLSEGYRYDSSLFPIRRPGGYGYPDAPQDRHWIDRPSGRLLEFPPLTLRHLGVSIPAGGGAYFRLFPYRVTRAAFLECERRETAGTFYVHPWELDPAQPRIAAPWHARFRHYTGLQRTVPRLERLLSEFKFGSIGDTLAATRGESRIVTVGETVAAR